ncbi:MAG: hypothetical protein KKC20_07520 [Proteobacteria bacterium]|nr:hypothetical protein [Pseudomonadota bacterium]
MKKSIVRVSLSLIFAVLMAQFAFATSGNKTMPDSDKFGDLIHESIVDGYSLSYYFMDLRQQAAAEKSKATSAHGSHTKEMDKPHHIMVYIMDSNQKQVSKGKIGFLIKDAGDKKQTAMGMFMSNGFGATADMKKKGIYTITTKAVLGDKKLMDRFEFEIK